MDADRMQPARLDRFFAPAAPWRWARWIWLRALGLLFASAFGSLVPQVHGLVGTRGILPATAYLDTLATELGPIERLWTAPTVLWLGAGDGALTALVAFGIAASLLLVANVAPRAMTILCTLLFLSFVAVGQEFANYQSDGMLLEAGFLSAFLAPPGIRPRLAASRCPSRAAVFLLQWEWFRIYFESGIVKLASGDRQWRTLTAMNRYYETGPLPTWIGWYVQKLPTGFHMATALATLVIELGVVWLAIFGRRARLVCFAVVTPLQLGIIATANYAFLNYLVLFLGIFLLDDVTLARLGLHAPSPTACAIGTLRRRLGVTGFALFVYATVAAFLVPSDLALGLPAQLLAPARVANRYGLFAVMTDARYEIELQGSQDGVTWTPYPFRYKPQEVHEAPGIYAPYQPRFEWNLWFASLGSWRANEWVLDAEARLLDGEPSVLRLFRSDPFGGVPPRHVRAVRWRYAFTSAAERRATGAWWTRELLGAYGPALVRGADGTVSLEGGGS